MIELRSIMYIFSAVGGQLIQNLVNYGDFYICVWMWLFDMLNKGCLLFLRHIFIFCKINISLLDSLHMNCFI